MATYGRAVPYPELCESVRRAALELLAEGRKCDVITLRLKGVKGQTQRVYMALADLVRSGDLPPECRHERPAHPGFPRGEGYTPTPDQVEAGRESLRGHAPEVSPPQSEPSIWGWLAAKYWADQRRWDWYRRAASCR